MNKAFRADAHFELTSESRRWATYEVTEITRGRIGTFRIEKENHYCDDRDEAGVLQLGDHFSGTMSVEEFADRFELLNWVYDVVSGFVESGVYPPLHFVST